MPTVNVGRASRSSGLFRYSYPVTLTFEDGSKAELTKYYSDFADLHDLLSRTSDAGVHNIPSIPERKWDGRSRVRERRRIAFQYLLEWCLLHCPKDGNVRKFFELELPAAPVSAPLKIDFSQDQSEKKSQNFVKVLIFVFLWLATWTAMFNNSKTDSLVSLQETSSALKTRIEGFARHDLATSPLTEQNLKFINHSTMFAEPITTTAIKAIVEEDLNGNELVILEEMQVTDIVVTDGESENLETSKASAEVEQVIQEQPLAATNEPIVQEDMVVENVVSEESVAETVPENVEELFLTKANDKHAVVTISKSELGNSSILLDTTLKIDESKPLETLMEKKKEVEFYFTPFHGLIAFLSLYVLVIAWSSYYPPKTERLASQMEIAFHNGNHLAVSSSSADKAKLCTEAALSTEEEICSFEQAEAIFRSFPQDEQESSRAVAFFMRATNETLDSNPSINVLTQFWQEACTYTSEEARKKFVELVMAATRGNHDESSLMSSSTFSATEDQGTNPHKLGEENENKQDEKEISQLEQQQTEPVVPTPQIVRWWDSKLQEQREQLLDDHSVITSFDSTDVSSLSMSPSPIRDQQRAQVEGNSLITSTLLFEDTMEESERKNQEKHGESMEIAFGTAIGFVGTALLISLASRTRRSLF